MAISIDFATSIISIPQVDLTLISGSLYELPTESKFRADINALMDDETGIVFDDPILHNTQVTVAGTTFSRTIEIINGYSITFENLTYSVRLAQSNNNLFDVENGILNPSGNVTVIAQNSAGLIVVTTGSGVTQQDKDDIEAQIFAHNVEGTENFAQMMRLIRASSAGAIVQLPDGSYLVKSRDGLTDRIDGSLGSNNSRNIHAFDPD